MYILYYVYREYIVILYACCLAVTLCFQLAEPSKTISAQNTDQNADDIGLLSLDSSVTPGLAAPLLPVNDSPSRELYSHSLTSTLYPLSY